LDEIFLQEVIKVFFGDRPKYFQPYRTSGFVVTAFLSSQNGLYLLFFATKFELNFLSIIDGIFYIK
jgi:hypothetical protein